MACYFFKLIPASGDALYLDDEPIKWDQVKIVLSRDPEWHGVNFEYTDGDIQLEFDCLSGKDFIEQIYQADGLDGYIGFEFGYYNGATEVIDYSGKLNLATRKYLDYRIGCSIERESLHDIVKTRWETKADMTANTSIDGDTITPPVPYNLTLHSQRLPSTYTKKAGPDSSVTRLFIAGDQIHTAYFVFNTTPDQQNASTIDETIGSNIGPFALDPVVSQGGRLFKMRSSGSFIFNIKLNFRFGIRLKANGLSAEPKIGGWSITVWLDVTDANGVHRLHKNLATMNGTRDFQELNATMNVSLVDFQYDVNAGDSVYLFASFAFDGYDAGWKGIDASIVSYGTEISVTAQTFTTSSSANTVFVHEALNQALAVISGQDDKLYSEFFGRTDIGYAVNGCGAFKALTNGFQIRRFAVGTNPIKFSLQELLKSLNAIFCIGIAYEGDLMRVEDRGYFYQDVEILSFEDIGDYEETVAPGLVNNILEIGYSKYFEDGEQLLDQFSTQHQYTSPIKSHDNKFSQLSSLIASGEVIEITRRYQYKETPKDSTKYDDDGFIVALRKVGSEYVTEKNEAFDLVTGILDPESAYNLRHTPHRNLLNWAKWLNGGFYFKSAGEIVCNTFVKQNGELVTRFAPGEPCPLGDINLDTLKESDSFYLAQFQEREYYFIPEWVTFKTRATMHEIRLLRDCMTGQNGLGLNYGYISIRMPSGDTLQGWIYKMSYNPNTEGIEFTLLKKKVVPLVPPVPFPCSDYADYTFADFEALPDLSQEIEQCRFLNFN